MDCDALYVPLSNPDMGLIAIESELIKTWESMQQNSDQVGCDTPYLKTNFAPAMVLTVYVGRLSLNTT